MASYMREIVCRCYRTDKHQHGERKIKSNRYSVESRVDVTTRTEFAWRLSCGHVTYGQHGHGKKRVICHACQMLDEESPYRTAEQEAEYAARWTDIPDDAAYETLRLKAQS